MTLLVSTAVLFLFLLNTPEVALYSNSVERDKDIHSVKEEADVSRLQEQAKMYIEVCYATGATATLLCRVALVSQLIVIGGAVVGLIQIRRVRRYFQANESAG